MNRCPSHRAAIESCAGVSVIGFSFTGAVGPDHPDPVHEHLTAYACVRPHDIHRCGVLPECPSPVCSMSTDGVTRPVPTSGTHSRVPVNKLLFCDRPAAVDPDRTLKCAPRFAPDWTPIPAATRICPFATTFCMSRPDRTAPADPANAEAT